MLLRHVATAVAGRLLARLSSCSFGGNGRRGDPSAAESGKGLKVNGEGELGGPMEQ